MILTIVYISVNGNDVPVTAQDTVSVRPGEGANLSCTTSAKVKYCTFFSPDGESFPLGKVRYLAIYLSIYIYLFLYLSIYLSIYLSFYLFVCRVTNILLLCIKEIQSKGIDFFILPSIYTLLGILPNYIYTLLSILWSIPICKHRSIYLSILLYLYLSRISPTTTAGSSTSGRTRPRTAGSRSSTSWRRIMETGQNLLKDRF